MREFRFYGERPQWDASLVAKVEQLIDIAIGEQGKNVVDFKMLQTILYILAHHLRILEQMVEVRAHGGEQAEEDIVEQSKQKAKHKDKATKSGKIGPKSSDGYISSDDMEESDDDSRGKTGDKGKESGEKYTAKKSARDDQGGRREKSIQRKKIRKDRSEDWFSDDEREESDGSIRVKSGSDRKSGEHKSKQYKGKDRDDQDERKEWSKDKLEESVKHHKEKRSREKVEGSSQGDKDGLRGKRDKEGVSEKGRDDESLTYQKVKSGKDDKSAKEHKARDKDEDSIRGVKSHKIKSGDDDEEILDKAKVTKSKDKIGSGKEKEEKSENKFGRRASDEGITEKGHKGKAKEGDKSGEKSKRRDSREKGDVSGTTSEERQIGGKKSRGGRHYVGSIEVVTQQQFRQLERAVYELEARIAIPTPHLPDNKKLMTDIAQGSATLPDVMMAMQLNARIVAAERAIERMAELVSLLAASGELPAEVLSTFTELEADVANMAEKVQSTGITKSPKEHGRKSLGLATLGTVSTLSTAEAEATAAMKRGILGTSGRLASEAKETDGDVKEGKEVKKGKKKGETHGLEKGPQTHGLEKGQQTYGLEKGPETHGLQKGQQTQEAEEGGLLFVQDYGDEHEKRTELVPASTSMGRTTYSKKTFSSVGCVTAQEMKEALQALREDFMKNVGNITSRANASAEAAVGIAKDVAAKLARAMTLNDRVSTLYSMVNDYAEQLRGFDTGVQMQMQSFQQQLNCIKGDLREGLLELHNITNNAETAAVLELKEQYQAAAGALDDTLHSHNTLLTNEEFLTSEVKGIAECIEELRDQKADKDEVIDGLRDKADLTRLEGLLSLDEFARIYEELELRMQMCYDKFRSQDTVWMGAVQEFSEVISAKADVRHMQVVRDEAQQMFQELNEKAALLKRVLGEPKAAVLTRKLTKGAMCAACAHTAMMEVSDVGTADPPRLPAFRPRPAGADEVCLRQDRPQLPQLTPYEDETHRPHMCKRWCGGSHTLLSPAITRETAPHFTAEDTGRSWKYMGFGTDNKLYMLAEPCQPCQECNVVEKIPGETEELSPHPGAGDQGDGPTIVTGREAHRVTIVADADIQLMRDELARKRRGLERRRSSGGARRPLEREVIQEMDSRGGYEDAIPRESNDIGVIVEGQITVLGEECARRAPVRHERARRSSLAQDRIREQFEPPLPSATGTDFISEAIAALSEL